MRTKLNGESLKILVCCHKPNDNLPANPDGVFLPIFSGAAINDNAVVEAQLQRWREAYGDAVRDDLLNGAPCDNISERNLSYGEFPPIYWAWKNIKKLYPNLEYIGVNHYRRYFSLDKAAPLSYCIREPENAAHQYTLNLGKLERVLSKHDAVMASPFVWHYSVATQYAICHHPHLRLLRRIVHDKYPEYDREMFNVLDRQNKLVGCHLFIMRWEDFDAYCAWIFDILFEAERQIIVDGNYNTPAGRIFAFMAERVFNVWVTHNGLKVKHLPFVWFAGGQNASLPRRAWARARCNLSFFFAKPWHKFAPERYAARYCKT